MDIFLISVIIIISITGIFLFWKLSRFLFKKLVGVLPKEDDGNDFFQARSEGNIEVQFEHIIKRLEAERLVYYAKTKGLFKRTFLKVWAILAIIFIALSILLIEDKGLNPAMFIGPIFGAAFLSLIGSGIYTAVKKGNTLNEFTKHFKKMFVSQLVYYVNPNFSFSEEGISEEVFDSADLFPSGFSSFKSEDKIIGNIDGNKVTISQCLKRGKAIIRESTKLKIKGVTISQDNEISGTKNYVDYFRGLFIQLELENIHIPSTLKILPKNVLKKTDVETGIEFSGFRPEVIKTPQKEDQLKHLTELEEKSYAIFCSAKEDAERLVNLDFIKLVDFVFDRFLQKRDSNDGESILGKMLFREREVYLTICNNTLNLALGWNKDLFEPDTFLKENLIESGIAQEIYEDLTFVDHVVKEVNQFNKLAF
jgi:hypothetical protein